MEKQNQTHDPAETQDEIQGDIHRTRERIDETLEAIKDQLAPGELIKQVMGYFRQQDGSMNVREKAGDALAGLGRMAKENPIPAALIAIGLLGMVRSGSNGARRGEHGKAGEKARDLAAGARESLEHGVEKVRERVDEAREDLRERVEEARWEVRDRVEDVRERIEDDPLVLAALGIALGAALGASLPRTRVEDELFGEKRDELAEKAKQVGEQLREGVRHAVEDASSLDQERERPQFG
jgi:hypothetical protein